MTEFESILLAIEKDKDDIVSVNAASDYIAEFPPAPVTKYYRIPIWFRKVWSQRVTDRFHECHWLKKPQHEYYRQELLDSFVKLKCRTSLDHWGQAKICGVDALVSDPYANAEFVQHDAVVFRNLLRMAVVGIPRGGAWRCKTDRIAFFKPMNTEQA